MLVAGYYLAGAVRLFAARGTAPVAYVGGDGSHAAVVAGLKRPDECRSRAAASIGR